MRRVVFGPLDIRRGGQTTSLETPAYGHLRKLKHGDTPHLGDGPIWPYADLLQWERGLLVAWQLFVWRNELMKSQAPASAAPRESQAGAPVSSPKTAAWLDTGRERLCWARRGSARRASSGRHRVWFRLLNLLVAEATVLAELGFASLEDVLKLRASADVIDCWCVRNVFHDLFVAVR